MKNPTEAIEHMRENCKRDVPWFEPSRAHTGVMIPVAGGPSLLSRLDKIKSRQRQGGTVVGLNGALRVLRKAGIEPSMACFIDPSEAVTGFLDDAPDSCVYLVASICHPKVLDKLKGKSVFLWHPDLNVPEQKDILDAYPGKPSALLGGGNTVGLRVLNVGFHLGYRKFHCYGLDSSYSEDGRDHAYTKHDGTEPDSMTVYYDGSPYRCSPWMARQADEFDYYYKQFTALGCQIQVHGEGLIPDMARCLKKEIRQLA